MIWEKGAGEVNVKISIFGKIIHLLILSLKAPYNGEGVHRTNLNTYIGLDKRVTSDTLIIPLKK